MRALVVYESLFGNTELVARAVAAGIALGSRGGMPVEVVAVRDAPVVLGEDLDLVVVGGPTHAFSMTRPSTREDALRQGGRPEAASSGIREWVQGLHSGVHPQRLAVFDTRVGKARHLPGSAARSAARALHKLGFSTPFRPESFYVEDLSGPLLDGELVRAHVWGSELALEVRDGARRSQAR
jgi:hypothetical protein